MKFFSKNHRSKQNQLRRIRVLADNPDNPANTVVTSRYTPLTFLPIFLFQQFSRAANAYFLLIIILQLIPSISLTGGFPSVAMPLAIILTFDGIVTAYEDFRRHRRDAEVNSTLTEKYVRDSGWKRIAFSDVRVGDILRMRNGDELPADCVFLCSDPMSSQPRNEVWLQTLQLDGETNLKLKQVPQKLHKITERWLKQIGELPHESKSSEDTQEAPVERRKKSFRMSSSRFPMDLANFIFPFSPRKSADKGGAKTEQGSGVKAVDLTKLEFLVEAPSPFFDRFNCTVLTHPGRRPGQGGGEGVSGGTTPERDGSSEAETQKEGLNAMPMASDESMIPLNAEALLLRGTVVKNVKTAYGLVVYTGVDCKIAISRQVGINFRGLLPNCQV